MRIIISPAKKMNVDADSLPCQGLPAFLPRTERLLSALRAMDAAELKRLWKCNDQIAALNIRRLEAMDLRRNLTPAILSYEGIQYQYMAPAVFEERMLAWVQEHLRILSGFYGVLKPMDGVTPYRLEMQARLSVGEARDLYAFWGGSLWEEICGAAVDGGDGGAAAASEGGVREVVLNLASKEYSRCIEKYLRPEDRFITCIFGEWSGGKIVQKGTYAKMARGEMVRFLAERQAERPEEARDFDRLGYRFAPEHSDEKSYVFVRMV